MASAQTQKHLKLQQWPRGAPCATIGEYTVNWITRQIKSRTLTHDTTFNLNTLYWCQAESFIKISSGFSICDGHIVDFFYFFFFPFSMNEKLYNSSQSLLTGLSYSRSSSAETSRFVRKEGCFYDVNLKFYRNEGDMFGWKWFLTFIFSIGNRHTLYYWL